MQEKRREMDENSEPTLVRMKYIHKKKEEGKVMHLE
jgi:hypothetical protein